MMNASELKMVVHRDLDTVFRDHRRVRSPPRPAWRGALAALGIGFALIPTCAPKMPSRAGRFVYHASSQNGDTDACGCSEPIAKSEPVATARDDAGLRSDSFFCEMLRPGQPQHPTLTLLLSRFAALPIASLRQPAADAERDLLERGITFTVYSDATRSTASCRST